MNIVLVIANTASIINNKFTYGFIFIKNNENIHNNIIKLYLALLKLTY